MSNQITSISLVKDKSLSNDVFQQKNGDRFHTTFTNDVIQDIFEKDDKCILTLLKGTTYSLSIKLKATSNTVNRFKNSFNNILVFDKNKNCFELNTTTAYDNFTVSHILIIGTANMPNTPATPFEFNGITKTFLIIIDNGVVDNTPKYKDVTMEEYLNLYYIEHFSLNIIEFSELYKNYKTNTGEGVGGQGRQGEEAGGEEVGGEAPEEGQGEGVEAGRQGEEAEVAGEGVEAGEEAGGKEVRGQGVEGVEAGEQRVAGGTEMIGGKKPVKKVKKNKNKVA